MVNVQSSFSVLAPLGSNKVPCKNTFIEIPDHWAESEGAFLRSLPQLWTPLPPTKAEAFEDGVGEVAYRRNRNVDRSCQHVDLMSLHPFDNDINDFSTMGEEAMPMKHFDLPEIPMASQHQWSIKNSFIEVKDEVKMPSLERSPSAPVEGTIPKEDESKMPSLEPSPAAPVEDNAPKEALQHLVLGVGGHLVDNLRLDADQLVETDVAMRAENLFCLSTQDVERCIIRTSQNSYARWFLGREIKKAASTNPKLKDCIEELSDQEDRRWYSLHVVMSGWKYQSLIWSSQTPPRHPDPSETMSKRGWEKACSDFRNLVKEQFFQLSQRTTVCS